jgi:hypothetical protein
VPPTISREPAAEKGKKRPRKEKKGEEGDEEQGGQQGQQQQEEAAQNAKVGRRAGHGCCGWDLLNAGGRSGALLHLKSHAVFVSHTLESSSNGDKAAQNSFCLANELGACDRRSAYDTSPPAAALDPYVGTMPASDLWLSTYAQIVHFFLFSMCSSIVPRPNVLHMLCGRRRCRC